jgi:hypothetical protein
LFFFQCSKPDFAFINEKEWENTAGVSEQNLSMKLFVLSDIHFEHNLCVFIFASQTVRFLLDEYFNLKPNRVNLSNPLKQNSLLIFHSILYLSGSEELKDFRGKLSDNFFGRFRLFWFHKFLVFLETYSGLLMLIMDFILRVIVVFVAASIVFLHFVVLGRIESFGTAEFSFEVVEVMTFHAWRLYFLEQDSILSLDFSIYFFLLEVFFLNKDNHTLLLSFFE